MPDAEATRLLKALARQRAAATLPSHVVALDGLISEIEAKLARYDRPAQEAADGRR